MSARLIRRIGVTTAVTAGLVVASGGNAFAHECFNASRSAQGNTMSGANSQAWWTIVVNDIIQDDANSGMLTQAQADCVKAAYAATGAPSSFTIHVKGAVGQDGTIGENNKHESKRADGSGIDHVLDAYGAQIFGSYAQCGIAFG